MKANEYVKQNGWTMARKAVAECTYGYGINLDDLKRLVESHELVEEYGGLPGALEFIRYAPVVPEIYKLRDAIEDVESCQ